MLPSKKILIALAILIVGIGALALYGYKKNSNTNYTSSSNQNPFTVATSSIDTPTSQIDSDHDGLPDWEEALYGTDPHNPDTDGDGTSDGKEIALGRNPLVKGPKDFLAVKDNPVATSTDKENLTVTDTFARDFFAKYIALQQSGTKVTSDNADQIAGDYLNSATLPSISAKQYTQADLLLTDSDRAHISNYQTAMNSVFNKYWPTGEKNELNIMQQALTNNNPKTLSDLTAIISAYQLALNNILAISVPKLAVSLHLNVVNSLAVYIQVLKTVQLSYTDPLSGLAGLQAFQTSRSNIAVSVTNLQLYFINSLK